MYEQRTTNNGQICVNLTVCDQQAGRLIKWLMLYECMGLELHFLYRLTILYCIVYFVIMLSGVPLFDNNNNVVIVNFSLPSQFTWRPTSNLECFRTQPDRTFLPTRWIIISIRASHFKINTSGSGSDLRGSNFTFKLRVDFSIQSSFIKVWMENTG